MSLICIEGVLGVGKTTLLDSLKDRVPCIPFFEDVESNPFLHDFYQDPAQYAIHVQCTFLLLQERRFRTAAVQARGNVGPQRRRKNVEMQRQETPEASIICDFHPFKSLIFSSVLLSVEKREPLRQLYRLLHIPTPDLVVYLRADAHTILARLRRKATVFQSEADITYIMQMCQAYDDFFRTYKGDVVTLDTTMLDYVGDPLALSAILQAVPLLYAQPPVNESREVDTTST